MSGHGHHVWRGARQHHQALHFGQHQRREGHGHLQREAVQETSRATPAQSTLTPWEAPPKGSSFQHQGQHQWGCRSKKGMVQGTVHSMAALGMQPNSTQSSPWPPRQHLTGLVLLRGATQGPCLIKQCLVGGRHSSQMHLSCCSEWHCFK